MATEPPTPLPAAADEPCAVCGAPLTADQRYCLNCGTRRGPARADLLATLAPPRPPAPVAAAAPAVAAPAPRAFTLVHGLGLAALLLLAVLTGAVLSGIDDDVNVAAAPVPDVNISVPAGGGGTGVPVADAEFVSDWTGDAAWTIQLQALPKEGTTPAAVQAAKQAALGQGAPEVGALDSDEYATLEPGAYVIYSGEYDSRRAARSALGKLKRNFPDAKVVEVAAEEGGASEGGSSSRAKTTDERELAKDVTKVDVEKQAEKSKEKLEELEEASGDGYVDKTEELPSIVVTPGGDAGGGGAEEPPAGGEGEEAGG